MANEIKINDENQYVDVLADLSKTSAHTNHDLLLSTEKEKIDAKEIELKEFLAKNEKDDTTFLQAVDLWNEFKDLVKNAECKFTLNGLESKAIYKKLHNEVEYDTETLFYGLHLKKHFVDSLPKIKTEFDTHESLISFSNAIAMYHVLSTVKVKGLNKDNYALAHVLYKLSEISKVYQVFDQKSVQLNQAIGQWNLGLKKEKADELHSLVAENATQPEPETTNS